MTAERSESLSLIDVQSQRPSVQLSLSRVGVTGVEKVIRLNHERRRAAVLGPLRVRRRPRPRSEGRAHVALRGGHQRGDRRGRARRVDVQGRDARRAHRAARARPARARAAPRSTVEARFPEHKPAPVSGIQTQELYTLHGSAICTELGTRRLIGVTAQGMTACPCAQELVAGRRARAPAASRASTPSEIERILEAVPVATHNQRGLGTLHIGCTELCDDEIDAGDAARDRRAVDVLGDLRADEALRRGARRREGPPPAAVRRGLRARDDPRRGRARSRSSTTARSSRRARSTSRRSTSTTWSRSGSGRSARSAASSRPAIPSRPTPAAAPGSIRFREPRGRSSRSRRSWSSSPRRSPKK